MLRMISKEDLFTALVQHSPTPTWILEEDRILFINEAGVQLLGGSSRSEFEGRGVYEFIHGSSQALVKARSELLRNGENKSLPAVEEYFLKLDGSVVPVLVTSQRFPLGDRVGFQVHFSDLTALQTAEQSARQTNAEIDLVSDKLPALVSYLDTHRRFVKVNAAYTRWMKMEPSELIGRRIDDVLTEQVGPEYWRKLKPALDRAFTGQATTTRTVGHYPSGLREVEVHYSPDWDGQGKVRGVAVLVVDITEREKARTELEFRATLLEEALEPIFAWHLPGTITFWNRAAEAVYGYTREEAIGRSSHSLLQTEAPVSMDELEACLRETGVWEGELTHTTKFGTKLVMEARLRRVQISGRLTVVECTRDVTQRKRAEESLLELTSVLERRVAERTEELSHANEELEAYAYSISHDLRAPLRTAQGFSDALLEDYEAVLDETGKMYARRIRAAAQRMDELIKDLLEYSRLGRANLLLERIDLSSVVQDVLQQQQASILEKQAAISVQPNLPAVIGHFSTLVQILGNLISNALKFTRPGDAPSLAIEVERRESFVCIRVRDSGIGIEMEHQDRIFRVFERLHGSETYPGTGIGLAIVKKGVERLGGTLGLKSEEGKGSCFWFELPSA